MSNNRLNVTSAVLHIQRQRYRPRKLARSLLAALLLTFTAACGTLIERARVSNFPSPVAYVTAGPLPQASPTPTLLPLAKPTDLPATVVPKKLPLDSTSAIGLWSDRITDTQAFTGVVDVATGNASLAMQKTDLALVSLNERQVYTGYGDTITDVVANHRDWVLYDRNGKATYSSGDNSQPLLNIRNSEVITQLADDVHKLVYDGRYDGILITGVGNDLIRSNTPPMITGTNKFTDKQRQDAVEVLLRAIRTSVPDKLLIIGGYAWQDGAAYSAKPSATQDLGSIGDGVYIDQFLRAPISSTTSFKSESDWKKDIDYLAAISQDGKIVLISTRIANTGVSTDTVKQWLNYSVASYLLGKNGNRTYFQFDLAGTLAYANDPVLTAPIGSPQEGYTKLSSGIYRRLFSNGIVLVNPTGESKNTQFDTGYHLPGGTESITKVTMSAHTGLVLLKP